MASVSCTSICAFRHSCFLAQLSSSTLHHYNRTEVQSPGTSKPKYSCIWISIIMPRCGQQKGKAHFTTKRSDQKWRQKSPSRHIVYEKCRSEDRRSALLRIHASLLFLTTRNRFGGVLVLHWGCGYCYVCWSNGGLFRKERW